MALTMSTSQVAEIRSEMARQGLKNITPVLGDMATCEFPNGFFDSVIAIEVSPPLKNDENGILSFLFIIGP